MYRAEEKVFDFQQECKQNWVLFVFVKKMYGSRSLEITKKKVVEEKNVFKEGKSFIFTASRFVIYVHSSTI